MTGALLTPTKQRAGISGVLWCAYWKMVQTRRGIVQWRRENTLPALGAPGLCQDGEETA